MKCANTPLGRLRGQKTVDFTGDDVEARGQTESAVSDVFELDSLRNTGSHRQVGVFALESLDAPFLIHAEHRGPLLRQL